MLEMVEHQIRVAADPQVALIGQAERSGGTGRHRHGNFIKRVLAIDFRQSDLAFDRIGQFLETFLPHVGTHQQLQDFRITPEATAIGMIGRQKNLPRILDQQQQFESASPLDGVDQIAGSVRVRDNPASGLVFHVEIAPFPSGQLVQQMLPGPVSGNRDSVPEQNGAGVRRNVGMSVEVVGQLDRLRTHRIPAVPAVGVVLRVGNMSALSFQVLQGLHRRRDVSGGAQVIAVQVHRMRQPQVIANSGQLRDDAAGRQLAVAFDGRRQLFGVLAPLPGGDTARINRFNSV